MGAAYDKAMILFGHKRYQLAREQLRQELDEHPDCSQSHALMALCLDGEENSARPARRLKTVLSCSQTRLSLTTHCRGCFVTMTLSDQLVEMSSGKIESLRGKPVSNWPEAHIREAMRLDPAYVAYHGLLAYILLDQEQPADAVDVARQALAIDPQHGVALNAMALAMRATDSYRLAADTSATALSITPQGAIEHAIHGYSLLLAGKAKQALEHSDRGDAH